MVGVSPFKGRQTTDQVKKFAAVAGIRATPPCGNITPLRSSPRRARDVVIVFAQPTKRKFKRLELILAGLNPQITAFNVYGIAGPNSDLDQVVAVPNKTFLHALISRDRNFGAHLQAPCGPCEPIGVVKLHLENIRRFQKIISAEIARADQRQCAVKIGKCNSENLDEPRAPISYCANICTIVRRGAFGFRKYSSRMAKLMLPSACRAAQP